MRLAPAGRIRRDAGGVWAFVGAAGALQLGPVLFLRSGAKHRPA
jgi:hypothetical protein